MVADKVRQFLCQPFGEDVEEGIDLGSASTGAGFVRRQQIAEYERRTQAELESRVVARANPVVIRDSRNYRGKFTAIS